MLSNTLARPALEQADELIPWVDQLLRHAQENKASDIHLEPYEKSCRIRYRQDGLLYPIMELPLSLAQRILTRLKVMANLDITERRLPQDGRLHLQSALQLGFEVRISTCPVLHGEKIVLRLLESAKLRLPIQALGFNHQQEQLFHEKLAQPQGLILVTGPTGSGKTVTLYSALHHLNATEKNILTVEDPIEIPVNGINQVQINPKLGLDYATTLRAFLRQDPDIIMVGEIRDRETAAIALEAAQTGHLVLASLHTNSALESLSRLSAMGSEAYHLAPALSLILAQRLIRKLCPHCKEWQGSFYTAKGCSACVKGYWGRMALFECLNLSEKLSTLILQKADTFTLLKTAKREGYLTLWERGQALIQSGECNLFELQRVLQE